MEDKFYFESVLNELKGLAGLLYNATVESSTQDVRATFNALLFDLLEMQNTTYQTMSNMGWYQTKPVIPNKIKEVANNARASL